MFNLDQFFDSLSSRFGNLVPNLLAAIIVLILGWVVAKFLRKITFKLLKKTKLDSKIHPEGDDKFPFSSTVSKLVYWLALFFLFMIVLNMLGVSNNVLDPLNSMLAKIAGYLPNIMMAGIIGFVGLALAKLASEAIGLISATIEGLAERLGFSGDFDLTKLIKQLVFLLVFLPILLIAFNALNISLISDPATKMFDMLFSSIPNIIAAVIILAVFIIGGKFLTKILAELLANLKVDNLISKAGLNSFFVDGKSLSVLISQLVYYFLIFFGIITAAEMLGFEQLTVLLTSILSLSAHILFGLIILILGNRISVWVSNYLAESDAPGLASIARFATIGLFLAIALKYMGIADDIVNLAFGLTLGAVAVAFALSFGLGGREAAGEQMKEWMKKFKKND